MDTNNNSNNQQKRSPLESLQEKLYQPGAKIGERPETPEIFAPREEASKKVETKWAEEGEQQFMSIKKYKKKKLISRLIATFFILAVAAAGYLGYIYFFQTFKKSDVSLRITGPESVESGENVEFSVSYQNRSDFDLENAVLVFQWPQGAVPKDSTSLAIEQRLGTIASGRAKSFVFEGQFFGATNDKLSVGATLKYVPKDQGKTYESKAAFESIISTTPFSVVMSMPPRAVSGNEVELLVEYQNLSETPFSDMQLKLEYPEGFVFSSSEPAPSFSNNIWEFDKISGKESGKMKIKGVLSGRDNENKLFQAFIGKSEKDEFIVYNEEDTTVVMSSTILLVYQTINESREVAASLNDRLYYKITYRNTSDIAIPNVVISAKLDGVAIDHKSFDINLGSFSGATNSIIWNAAGVRELGIVGPGEQGEVKFSLRIKDKLDIASFNDKNFVVSSTVKVESDQIPESLKGIPIGNEDKVDVKVNTVVDFSMRGFYKDAPIENTGPMPPRVGQKTTYNIVWQLTNTSNDIDNARIEASLPPNVAWESKISPQTANIAYDKSSGKIVWDIGKIPSGAGFIMPAMQAAFKVSILPGLADVGKTVELISKAKFEGTDSFTGISLSQEEDKKTTYLIEDSYIIEMRGDRVTQ